MGCPERIPVPASIRIEVKLKVFDGDFKCHFCKAKKPAGSMAVEYLINGVQIAIACLWHKMCKTFEETGKLCQNHEQGLDTECNEIQF